MSTRDAIESVARFLEKPLKEHGLWLYDIEFVKEGPHWYLRIYIDKDGGVMLDDCELISHAAEGFLDETDPIPQAYILEVSSPGLDRPLKKDADFMRYMGHMVDIRLYRQRNRRKKFQGELIGFENNIISIRESDGSELSFEHSEVAACRLSVII